MDITRIYNYYPGVVLSDLSDLFSDAAFTGGNKLCVISYLSRTLRIGDALRFTNKYVLFLESTSTVDAIDWSYILYDDEHSTTDHLLLMGTVVDQNEYVIEFGPTLLDINKELKYARVVIKCAVTRGAETKVLEVEHAFVKSVAANALFSENQEFNAFIGNPDTTNFLVNYIKDYCPKDTVTWNTHPLMVPGTGEDSLIYDITSLLYYKTLTYFEAATFNNIYYDIDRHDNAEIRAFILADTMGTTIQNTSNGICELPLHLLSDAVSDLTIVPDYANIENTNKLYEMLSRTVIAGQNPDDTAQNDEESDRLINESKLRLAAQKAVFDGKKLIDLYNLSRFPKSAIRLSAILFKFIFRASQKNGCKECLYKGVDWGTLTLDDLKTKENFLRNLYTHYLEGPVNKVTAFRRPARMCAQYAISPHVYTIINFPPRILKAYFAKKVVVEDGGNLSCFFKRVDSKHRQQNSAGADLPYDAVMGREIYLVIETIGLSGKQLLCQIRPSKDFLTGDTNKLGLMAGNAQVDEHTLVVGNFAPLANNANSFAHYVNLAKHHSDKAFIRLNLRPQSRVTFDLWTTNLDNNAADNRILNLEIFVRMSGAGEAYFGDEGHGTSGKFLDTADKGVLRVVNRTFYEIFKNTNGYKYPELVAAGADMLICKIENNQVSGPTASYYYHDENDNEHYFGDFPISITAKWPLIPANAGLLVRMVEGSTLAEYNKNGVHIRFLTVNSPRHWVDLDCFAGLLGAMAVNNIADLGFNGFSNADGSPTPSSSHLNGIAGDLRLLRTTMDGLAGLLTDARFDFNRQNQFNDSLFDYGWARAGAMFSETFTRGGVAVLLHHTLHLHTVTVAGVPVNSSDVVPNVDFPQLLLAGPNAGTQVNVGTVVRHNDHLHTRGFDPARAVSIF